MNIFRKRKKQNRFLELLTQQAEFTVQGLEALREYVKQPDEALAERVSQIEKEADEARRILIDELNRTFVTPFDREDIFALSLTIDDVLDYANTTVDSMVIFKVELPGAGALVLGLVSSIDIPITALGYRTGPGGVFEDRAHWRRTLTLRIPSLVRLMAEAEDLIQRFMDVIGKLRWSALGDYNGTYYPYQGCTSGDAFRRLP